MSRAVSRRESMGSRASQASQDDDFRQKAMAMYSAKGKAKTLAAAAGVKRSSSQNVTAFRPPSDSESEISDLSESDDGEEPEQQSMGRRRGFDGETDDHGATGAQLAKKQRERSKAFKVLDKLCPCCAVSGQTNGGQGAKYAEDDPNGKIYQSVDNTVEPILRLLSLFMMGVPSTESAVPGAHLLPLVVSSIICLGGCMLFGADWLERYPLNAAAFGVLFLLSFSFLVRGSSYFRDRRMSMLVQELEGRSWNWLKALPTLMFLVNAHSVAFLLILTLGYIVVMLGYFVLSGLSPAGGATLVFYVSRVTFGFYIHGVIYSIPLLFSLEAALLSSRIKSFEAALGKFPNLDSIIEEHLEMFRCIERLSAQWGKTIAFTSAATLLNTVLNIHYLLNRESWYFLQNIVVPMSVLMIFLFSASRVTERCRHIAVHLAGYRSSADMFLAPLERIDFLTYLRANDAGFRVLGVCVTAQATHRLALLMGLLLGYLFTLQLSSTPKLDELVSGG